MCLIKNFWQGKKTAKEDITVYKVGRPNLLAHLFVSEFTEYYYYKDILQPRIRIKGLLSVREGYRS